jgi:Mn2+/Fe2+ NRAMP family transporter
MTILSQVLDGVLLPFVLYFMLKLINKKELMGKHTNSQWFNWVAYATSVIVVGLTLVMMWQQIEQLRGKG